MDRHGFAYTNPHDDRIQLCHQQAEGGAIHNPQITKNLIFDQNKILYQKTKQIMKNKNFLKLQEKLQENQIDFYILPNSCEFFLEYLPKSEKRIEFLTDFSGSNAALILNKKQSFFLTDSRYLLQAKNQIDKNFQIVDMSSKSTLQIIKENAKKSQKIAIHSKLVSINFITNLKKLEKKIGFKIIFLELDFVDEIWQKKPQKPNSKIFHHKIEFSGVESCKKIINLSKEIKKDAYFLANCESICWLLNIRASDIEYSPLLISYSIIYKNNEIDIFIDKKRLEKACFSGLEINFLDKISDFSKIKLNAKNKKPKINIINPKYFEKRMEFIKNFTNSIEIDKNSVNFYIFQLLKSQKIEIYQRQNPILIKKAVKNKVEIQNFVKAHKIDGLAMVKFLSWLENSIKNNEKIDELLCEEKLLEFRKKSSDFHYPSFRSISAFGANGAIVHYSATSKTNKKFDKNSLYLIDSGGQYNQGTTDITRTIAIHKTSEEMRENFTLVLKGHIAFATAKFNEKTPLNKLDFLARQFLLKQGKDFGHSTSHGVGSFLSVHENPPSIGKKSVKSGLKAGMVLSNEPGFYLENQYGIRIENLVLVKKIKGFLTFQTLTLAPIDINLILVEILTENEKKWLKNYHKKIFETLKNDLDIASKAYLEGIYDFYKKI